MKKSLYAFAIFAVSFWSCDTNPDDLAIPTVITDLVTTSSNSTVLPTKVDIVYSDGSTETLTYTFSDMALIKETSSDGYYTDYIYENDALTKVNYYDTPDQILETYTHDALGRVITIETNIVGAGVYDYNQTYSTDNALATQSSVTNPTTDDSTLTFNNGNITNSTEDSVYSSTYTYDSKNSVFRNVDFRGRFVTIDSENNDASNFTFNNILSETTLNNSTSQSETTTYEMTYTAFSFPKIVTENDGGDITTYTYTYNKE